MNTNAEVCGQCGVVGCQCGQELAGEVRRRGGARSRPAARRAFRPARRAAPAPQPARRHRRRLPRWMVGRPWWMRRPRPQPRPSAAPPPIGGYAPYEPSAEPAPIEEPVEDAAAQSANEPAAEPIEQPAPGDDSAAGDSAASDDPSAGGEPTAGGEEELGAWIRRAAAAAIRTVAPRAARAIRAAAVSTAATSSPTTPSKPDLKVHRGDGGGGGGSGGGSGGGGPDSIVTVLRWARMSVVRARTAVQDNSDLDAAAAEVAHALRSVQQATRLPNAANYLVPLVRNIAHAHARLMTRTSHLNDTSLQPYVDVVSGLLRRIDQLIHARQQQLT